MPALNLIEGSRLSPRFYSPIPHNYKAVFTFSAKEEKNSQKSEKRERLLKRNRKRAIVFLGATENIIILL